MSTFPQSKLTRMTDNEQASDVGNLLAKIATARGGSSIIRILNDKISDDLLLAAQQRKFSHQTPFEDIDAEDTPESRHTILHWAAEHGLNVRFVDSAHTHHNKPVFELAWHS